MQELTPKTSKNGSRILTEPLLITYGTGLNEETKRDVDALKKSLIKKIHTPEKQYALRVDLFSIRQTDLLKEYIERLDNSFNQLSAPIVNRLHYFIFGLKTKS